MGKKDDDNLAELVEELISDVAEDRDRLVEFLDKMLSAGYPPGEIAEYVAKIAAELTRQNQVKVATIKALGKNLTAPDDDDDDIHDEIGRPFQEDVDEGSN